MTSDPGQQPTPGPHARLGPADAVPAEWRPVTGRVVPAVAWTLARAGAPGSGPVREALAAWCVPLMLLVVLLGPRRFHRDAGTLTASLHRPAPPRTQVLRVLVGLALYLAVAWGLRGLVDGDGPALVLAVLAAYAAIAAVVQGLGRRRDRTAAERRGPVRSFGLPSGAWELGRVVARDGDRLPAMPAVGGLVDQVVPPGQRVVTTARSDAEQAALERIGFNEVRGEHGVLELTTPVAR